MAKAKKRSRQIKSSKNRKTINPERYQNLSFLGKLKYKSRLRAEKRARQHAQMRATLPKKYPARFFAHFQPKRVFHYWFSLYGLHQFAKIVFACFLLAIIGVGGLFVVYKQSLEDIQLSDINISETVNTYYDRNGNLLWQDIGDEDYRLVVPKDEMSTFIRQATVAIEDKNFYNHKGVDLTALLRATMMTLSGQQVQGGSTLTQQLIKQVYFADEAASENRGGIIRKIKELILALELEKMYQKEDIITMYLNESPYGGRRNGVESAAQTYFKKNAKDLNLAESALLAAIPNNPAIYNPYNEYGHEALIERQHKVLDAMYEQGYIQGNGEKTAEEVLEEAKAYDILATIQPESNQYTNIQAPHFVLEVKKQLEAKYPDLMNQGGLHITTTIDLDAQRIAEDAVAAGIALNNTWEGNGSDNAALVSLDVETSQVIAMVGSYDFFKEGYGEVNVTTSLIEPGSSIKPVLDYAPLFQQRGGQNFGPGSVLKDENIDSIYCNGYIGGNCRLRNYTGSFYGNVTIRKALANSLNIPAVKALYINGIENSLDTLHKLGDVSYCTDTTAGLSVAIGSGCNVRLIEHANTYASIARGGSFKDIVYVLEIKDHNGNVVESWADTKGERVVDEQVAYMISNILSDAGARSMVFGASGSGYGFVIPGVWTASKTGTTTTSNSQVTKDSLMISYSTAVATVVWNGNHDGSGVKNSNNYTVRRMVANYMERVHKEVYASRGKWKSGDQPVKPAGIQTLTVNGTTDIWPSWYSTKTSGMTKEKMDFNKYTKKLAAACTPNDDKVSIEVTKIIDPVTLKATYVVPEGYDKDNTDDCKYTKPSVSVVLNNDKKSATVTATKGTYPLNTYSIIIDGEVVLSGELTTNPFVFDLKGTEKTIVVVVTDTFGTESSASVSVPVASSSSNSAPKADEKKSGQ